MTTRPTRKSASEKTPAPKARTVKSTSDGGSLDRLLGLLGLFTPATPIVSADDMISALGLSRSSGYRYVKALSSAGMVAAVANGRYVLGPRIIQLDRQIRDFDPLYNAGLPAMRDYVRKTGHSALLNALYSTSVVCIGAELAAGAPTGLFSRGQSRSLIAGSSSRAILPYLPAHQLPKLYKAYEKPIAAAGLGKDWKGFKETLASIRKDGYASSVSEFNPGVTGIAAPIFNPQGAVIGSFSVSITKALARDDFDEEAAHVIDAADHVSMKLGLVGAGETLLPRAVGRRADEDI